MNTIPSVQRDERTVAVENASYKWACIFFGFALLIDVMYRGAVRDEAAWDLMALVIIGSGIATMYQIRKKTLMLSRRFAIEALFLMLFSGVVAAIVASIMIWSRS